MVTRLKSSKPFWAWLSFFLAMNGVVVMLLGLAALHRSGQLDILQRPFRSYEQSSGFKLRTSYYFQWLLQLTVPDAQSRRPRDNRFFEQTLANEGENLKYAALNLQTGQVVSNLPAVVVQTAVAALTADVLAPLPTEFEQYNYFWYFDGYQVRVVDQGQEVDTRRLDSGYRTLVPTLAATAAQEGIQNSRVLLAVRNQLVNNPYGQSQYMADARWRAIVGWGYWGLGLVNILLLAYAFIYRNDKRLIDRRLAAWSSRLWLEVKLLVSLFGGLILLVFGVQVAPRVGQSTVAIDAMIFVGLGLWWFYILLVDLIINREEFFRQNSVKAAFRAYRVFENRYPWQRQLLIRAYGLIAAELLLTIFAVVCLLTAVHSRQGLLIFVAMLVAALGLYILYRYICRFSRSVTELGQLVGHIERINSGDTAIRLEIAPDSDLAKAAEQLNSLQAGIGFAVSEKLKAERLKVDLITNVSHDLKTPLTSIISYTELLGKETGLPEHVSGYIKILAQKSERLKHLIQNLFDLAKASSDNLNSNLEPIDFGRLLRQTLADLDEPIAASGLVFRVNIPEQPVMITSDGDQLYRVWENLISNALKYSLPDSRVYIDLRVDNTEVVATIKNIAKDEMNFSAEDIMQRFVRGDPARSTDGSGLGLAIAQTFTRAGGGQFAITIDGDLFKAELRFARL